LMVIILNGGVINMICIIENPVRDAQFQWIRMGGYLMGSTKTIADGVRSLSVS
jgi:hypothetical protein